VSWPAPRTRKILAKLGLDNRKMKTEWDRQHERQHSFYEWHGFRIQNALDALVCEELADKVEIVRTTEMLDMVKSAVRRETKFCTTVENYESLYSKFRALHFERFGVKLPPRLKDVEERKEFKQLQPAPNTNESAR
jgi:hypothetical protein